VNMDTALKKLPPEVWLYKHRLLGGHCWAKEIEVAIDRCDLALALLSEGSYQSDICRAEQERSLAKSKVVIPVPVAHGSRRARVENQCASAWLG
jgi:hypothetical protein